MRYTYFLNSPPVRLDRTANQQMAFKDVFYIHIYSFVKTFKAAQSHFFYLFK
jgi:hypothetical protein